MDYTAEITIQAAHPLTQDALFDVAEIGGSAQGNPGERRFETTLTVRARDPREATRKAIEKVTGIVPGEVLAVRVMTIEEFDRRANEKPRLVGVGEVAKMLGVSKQRVSTLRHRDDFPEPVASLASGPVWRAGDLSTFAQGWQRKPGRPARSAVAG